MAFLVVLAAVVAAPTMWLAIRSVDFTIFLSGAFLVSSGTLLYLHLLGVSVPVVGTDLVLDPSSHLNRSYVHAALFCSPSGPPSSGVGGRRRAGRRPPEK